MRALLGALLLCAASACAGLPPTGADLSSAFEPPRSWDSGIFFIFGDSSWVPHADYRTIIEFHDGLRQRTITSRDLFYAPTTETRTPWYRLRAAEGGFSTTIRITLEHAGGARTTAEYPITVQRDEFAIVYARVYTRDPNSWFMSMPPFRKSFPLHPSARAQPGDSLWVEHAGRERGCFDCPS